MLEQTYKRNGVCYIFKVEKLIKSNTLAMNKTGYYLCDNEMISIDTQKNLNLQKNLIKILNTYNKPCLNNII